MKVLNKFKTVVDRKKCMTFLSRAMNRGAARDGVEFIVYRTAMFSVPHLLQCNFKGLKHGSHYEFKIKTKDLKELLNKIKEIVKAFETLEVYFEHTDVDSSMAIIWGHGYQFEAVPTYRFFFVDKD